MSLDQSRHDRPAAGHRCDGRRARPARRPRGRPGIGDLAVFDQHGRIRNGRRPGTVHELAVGDQRHSLRGLHGRPYPSQTIDGKSRAPYAAYTLQDTPSRGQPAINQTADIPQSRTLFTSNLLIYRQDDMTMIQPDPAAKRSSPRRESALVPRHLFVRAIDAGLGRSLSDGRPGSRIDSSGQVAGPSSEAAVRPRQPGRLVHRPVRQQEAIARRSRGHAPEAGLQAFRLRLARRAHPHLRRRGAPRSSGTESRSTPSGSPRAS